MYKAIAAGSLAALFVIGIRVFINSSLSAPPPMDEYEKQLEQVAKVNRSFQLPNAQILNQVISDLGMEYFLEKTDLVDKIADRYLKETGIYVAVNLAYYDYGQYVKNNMSPEMLEAAISLQQLRPVLINTIIRASKEVKTER